MLWSGLLHSLLENLLEFRVVDGGVMALQWKNRSLKEFGVEKYFADEARRVHTSGVLADYFSGNLQSIETLHNAATSKQSCTTVKLMHVTFYFFTTLSCTVGKSDTEEVVDQSPVPSKEDNIYKGRTINAQPLIIGEDLYNTRRLIELPYALTNSKRYVSV